MKQNERKLRFIESLVCRYKDVSDGVFFALAKERNIGPGDLRWYAEECARKRKKSAEINHE